MIGGFFSSRAVQLWTRSSDRDLNPMSPNGGHSDALGWKKLRGEAGEVDRSQHQPRVKGVDKRRDMLPRAKHFGHRGPPHWSPRIPDVHRAACIRGEAMTSAGGQGRGKYCGRSGRATCRWASRAQGSPCTPAKVPGRARERPTVHGEGTKRPPLRCSRWLLSFFPATHSRSWPSTAVNRSPANNAGRQHQTGCPQHRHEWLASHQTTAPQQLQSLEPRGTCRGEPPKRTRGSDLFLPVDDLQRSLASVQNLRNGAATAHQAGFCSPQQNSGRSRFPGP